MKKIQDVLSIVRYLNQQLRMLNELTERTIKMSTNLNLIPTFPIDVQIYSDLPISIPPLNISIKPQHITITLDGEVLARVVAEYQAREKWGNYTQNTG